MVENAVGRNAAISYPGQGIKPDGDWFGQVVWLRWWWRWRYNIVRKSGLKGKNCISELTKEEEEESNFIQGGKGGGVGALDMVLPKQLFSL